VKMGEYHVFMYESEMRPVETVVKKEGLGMK
jgi:hypothetical protein